MASAASSPQGLVLLGLTGGIGSGKSTASKSLCEVLDALHVDADRIVGELLQSPEVLSQIEVALGKAVTTGAGCVDRNLLSAVIFHDDEARQAVEEVLHPAVRRQVWQELVDREAEQPASFAILDVPLLRESGLDRICDSVLHVEVLAAERCRRACSRHGWTEAQWQSREDAQMPVDRKAALADAILKNDAGTANLMSQVQALAPTLRRLKPSPLAERWPAWDQLPSA